MVITNKNTIGEIQKFFNHRFPYVAIEFFKEKENEKSKPSLSEKWEEDKTIGEIRTINQGKDLIIDGHLKLKNLESTFQDLYGLSVQVFYKCESLKLIQDLARA